MSSYRKSYMEDVDTLQELIAFFTIQYLKNFFYIMPMAINLIMCLCRFLLWHLHNSAGSALGSLPNKVLEHIDKLVYLNS